jgi:hypothetical protein
MIVILEIYALISFSTVLGSSMTRFGQHDFGGIRGDTSTPIGLMKEISWEFQEFHYYS